MFTLPSFPCLRHSALFALALLGAGCTVIVDDDGDNHDGHNDAGERCHDDYEECVDDADRDVDDIHACSEAYDRCNGADAEQPTSGAADDADDSAGQDEVGDSTGPDDEGGQPAAEICVSLHQNCLADAQSVADTLACEALFDHCAHPEQCESCPHACPEAGLTSCLDDYGGCVLVAAKDYEVDACNLVFNGCVDELGAPECLPEDDAQVDGCLAEHALCTACAEGEDGLAVCKDLFDSCVNPPM